MILQGSARPSHAAGAFTLTRKMGKALTARDVPSQGALALNVLPMAYACQPPATQVISITEESANHALQWSYLAALAKTAALMECAHQFNAMLVSTRAAARAEHVQHWR